MGKIEGDGYTIEYYLSNRTVNVSLDDGWGSDMTFCLSELEQFIHDLMTVRDRVEGKE